MPKRSNGEGTITKRSDDRWAGAVTMPDGTRKWCYGKTQQEVVKKFAALRQERDRGLPISKERRTLADYMESWLRMAKPSLRPGTLANYSWYTRKYIIPTLGNVPLTKLNGEHVQRLLATRSAEGLASTTVRTIYSVLHAALNEAVALGLIPRNVATGVRKPRLRRVEMKAWNPEQARKFLAVAANDRLYALYVVALSTGLREGELMALRWSDVTLPDDGSDGALRIQHTLHWQEHMMSLDEVKTDSRRRQIHLSARATQALREHRKRQLEERTTRGAIWRRNDLVFCNQIGGALRVSNFRRDFRKLIARAGVPFIRPYDMRHTAATLLLLAGIHVKVVSEMLGHSSVAITLTIYSHVLPMIQRDAAAAMDRLLHDHGGEDLPGALGS
jgi:integrase